MRLSPRQPISFLLRQFLFVYSFRNFSPDAVLDFYGEKETIRIE